MARPSAVKDIFSRFSKLFNVPVKIDRATCTSGFKLPGIQYDDFDRAGYVNVYKINRMLEGVRPMTITHFYDESVSQHGQFIAFFGQHCNVYEPFYQKAAMDFPMEVTMTMPIAIGRTSIIREITLTNDVTKELLATARQKLVNMELKTGKAIDLPPDVLKYSDIVLSKPDDVFPKIVKPGLPTQHFTSYVEVHHSDLDMIFHTNQASYLKFALNCAAKAANNNFLTEIKEDVCFYKAKSCSTFNIAETFAGDKLTVKVWEDDHEPFLLHFLIQKHDQDVYYTGIEFYKN